MFFIYKLVVKKDRNIFVEKSECSPQYSYELPIITLYFVVLSLKISRIKTVQFVKIMCKKL
jgi:hypothetical protein